MNPYYRLFAFLSYYLLFQEAQSFLPFAKEVQNANSLDRVASRRRSQAATLNAQTLRVDLFYIVQWSFSFCSIVMQFFYKHAVSMLIKMNKMRMTSQNEVCLFSLTIQLCSSAIFRIPDSTNLYPQMKRLGSKANGNREILEKISFSYFLG